MIASFVCDKYFQALEIDILYPLIDWYRLAVPYKSWNLKPTYPHTVFYGLVARILHSEQYMTV